MISRHYQKQKQWHAVTWSTLFNWTESYQQGHNLGHCKKDQNESWHVFRENRALKSNSSGIISYESLTDMAQRCRTTHLLGGHIIKLPQTWWRGATGLVEEHCRHWICTEENFIDRKWNETKWNEGCVHTLAQTHVIIIFCKSHSMTLQTKMCCWMNKTVISREREKAVKWQERHPYWS